jgi:hypothetical protein
MPHAVVLNSASKAATTGGTFADTLTANSGDSLAIPNLQSGKGRILRMWGVDSDSVMELALTATRVDSVHDPQYGVRFNNPALAFGGAAAGAAYPMIEPPNYLDVYTGDTLTFTVTTTAADDVLVSWLTEYDDLPGAQAKFASWDSIKANRFTEIGVRVIPVASATPGAYGATRAINADDTRWTGGKWYGVLGWTVQTQVTTVSIKGPMWANLRMGGPSGQPFLYTDNYFVQLSQWFNKPLIPVFNGYDSGSVLMEVADGEASTSPKVDLICVECNTDPSILT